MGRDHALRLSRDIVGAELSVLADLDGRRAEAVADEIETWYGRRPIITTDALAAVRHEETDAVLIASHDSTHAELVLAAIDRGIPVLCEKPLAPTVEECREIVDRETSVLAPEDPRLVSIGFMRRFDERCKTLKQEVRGEGHGAALMAHCLHRNADPMPGGSDHTVTGSAVHEFDFLPWLFDSPIAEVAWMAGRSSRRTARQDPQLLLLRTESGVLVTLEMFVSAAYGYEVGCEVVFERGTVRFRDDASLETRSDRRAGHSFQADALKPYAEAYRSEVQTWIRTLEIGHLPREPLANAWDGLMATQVAQAMLRAMEQDDGRFIPVPTLERPVVYARGLLEEAARG